MAGPELSPAVLEEHSVKNAEAPILLPMIHMPYAADNVAAEPNVANAPTKTWQSNTSHASAAHLSNVSLRGVLCKG